MPNRIIKESIRTSKKVNALTDFQFRVWVHLITYVDDFGRGSADPELIKGLLFPRRKGVTETNITNTFRELEQLDMVRLYEADGEPYFFFPNWDQHQSIRAKKSKFPEPDSSLLTSASTCMQMHADESKCPRNPIQSNTNTNTESNTESEYQSNVRKHPPTVEEVQAYCNEEGFGIDACEFVDYYASQKWKKANGQPLTDWKAGVRYWARKRKESPEMGLPRKERERMNALADLERRMHECEEREANNDKT